MARYTVTLKETRIISISIDADNEKQAWAIAEGVHKSEMDQRYDEVVTVERVGIAVSEK